MTFNKQEIRKEVLFKLKSMAHADGIITSEERELIDEIMKPIDKYLDTLEEALADGEISVNERVELFNLRLKIISETIKAIRKDFIVTQDEKALFNLVQSMFPEMSKLVPALKKEEKQN